MKLLTHRQSMSVTNFASTSTVSVKCICVLDKVKIAVLVKADLVVNVFGVVHLKAFFFSH